MNLRHLQGVSLHSFLVLWIQKNRSIWIAPLVPAVIVFMLTSLQPAAGQVTSSWVFVGSDGQLHYKTDSQGNRIMDFSWAGYKGGGVPLPSVPVQQTLSP